MSKMMSMLYLKEDLFNRRSFFLVYRPLRVN